MHPLNKHTIILSIGYVIVIACIIYFVSFLILRYFTALAGLISWSLAATFAAVTIAAPFWNPAWLPSSFPVRKPIATEEKLISDALHKLSERSQQIKTTPINIMLTNEEQPEAFAIGRKTICLSSGMLCISTEEELSAVLAHEFGHILCWDTFCDPVYGTAKNFSKKMQKIFSAILHMIWLLPGAVKFFHLIAATFLFYVYPAAFLNLFAAFLLPTIGLSIINTFSEKLYLYFDRLTEYRQDAFAQSLGFGNALKMILLKMYFISPHPCYTFWQLINRGTHPILHNRIRRIEQLELSNQQQISSRLLK